MNSSQWISLAQGLFTVLLMVVGVFFARARAEQVGREELLKSLKELREQIGDRDRTALGLREELKSMEGRVNTLSDRVHQQESQILSLVGENLSLKSQLESLVSENLSLKSRLEQTSPPKPRRRSDERA